MDKMKPGNEFIPLTREETEALKAEIKELKIKHQAAINWALNNFKAVQSIVGHQKREDALQALVDDAQELGFYDNVVQFKPLPKAHRARLPAVLKSVVEDVLKRLGGGWPEVSEPFLPDGVWFIDFSLGKNCVVLQYSPNLGFGLSLNPESSSIFSDAPDERLEAFRVVDRVVEVLRDPYVCCGEHPRLHEWAATSGIDQMNVEEAELRGFLQRFTETLLKAHHLKGPIT